MPSSLPSGATNLKEILSSLQTTLHPATFVFLTFPPSASEPPGTLFQQMSLRESEGLTVITTLESAEQHGLDYLFPCRMITCEVHTSLEGVGFMAVISDVLAKKNMGVNPVSGFFHDHLFVPLGREEEAVAALGDLAASARKELLSTERI
ncbi:MAG: hypothetical protein MMC33_001263 [Icmadophila ericetorum]|nr:hypothetical protein [Icmadophila ericetorum]